MQLHEHEAARLRDLRPGDELLVVRPVEPQPTHSHSFLTDGIEHPCCSAPDGTCGGEIKPTHRPGDAVEVRVGPPPLGLVSSRDDIVRTTATRVEARQVSNVTAAEWGLAGWLIPVRGLPETGWRHLVPTWWLQTYAPLGPEYAWDRAWCWCEWWSLAAAQAAGGKDDD